MRPEFPLNYVYVVIIHNHKQCQRCKWKKSEEKNVKRKRNPAASRELAKLKYELSFLCHFYSGASM